MIKKLRVTVDGNTYDVTVELPDENTVLTPSAQPPPPPAVASPPSSAARPPAAPPGLPQPTTGAAASTPGDVPSPLAGRVTAVVVTVGQDVREGDHLLTLEAMKMNTFVFAPRSGKVAAVKVAVGEAVQEGQSLATIQ